ncbi:hypothetical protein QCD58_004548 [Enterobacter hormaechei]|nr:hypothetical protein [Enterobacter hormaechei]
MNSYDEWYLRFMRHSLDTLMKRAFFFEGAYHWRHINIVDERAIKASIHSIDLYDGVSGIALTFYHNGKKYNIKKYTDFSMKLSRQLIHQLKYIPTTSLGFFSGSMGVIYALTVINENKIPFMLQVIQKELEKISYILLTTNFSSYSQLDIMNGVAGTLLGLIKIKKFYEDYPIKEKINSIAKFAFDLLKNKAMLLLNENTLLGYSHGTAGVSAVLAKYMIFNNITDKDAVQAITKNTRRENKNKTAKGWPDFSAKNNCNVSWCHGIVGFGFSRLDSQPFIDSEVFHLDIDKVKERLTEQQESFSLCHGMGASYILAKKLGLYNEALNILKNIKNEADIYGYKTDFGLHNFEMVGAMNGVCGLFVGDLLLN